MRVKKLIDRKQLKNFMQVRIDVTCKYTSFSGRGLSGIKKFTYSNFPITFHGLKGNNKLVSQIRLKKLDACKAYIYVCVHEVWPQHYLNLTNTHKQNLPMSSFRIIACFTSSGHSLQKESSIFFYFTKFDERSSAQLKA